MIVIGSATVFLAGVTSFARFDETGVEIGHPLALRSKFYEYTCVKVIEHRTTFQAPNGNIIARPHHVITFDDGASWSSRGGLRDPNPSLDGRIVELVAQKSGLSVVEIH
jgi:hypothetical protein